MDKHEEYIRKTFDKIDGSDVFLSIVTQNYLEADAKCALEIGFAVLLDKPIRLLAEEGTTMPENLKKVADKIEYFKAVDDIGIVAQRLIDKE